LEEALERTAARPTIEPDCDFVDRGADSWLVNEEEGPRVVVNVDWHETRIDLAQVKIEQREGFNVIFLGLISCDAKRPKAETPVMIDLLLVF